VVDLQSKHVIVVGAGASGLMAARDLGRAGIKVSILEARDRCGGRIDPLPSSQFGYPAEGGAEFVHGEARVTRGLLREAGLSLVPLQGARWSVTGGKLSREQMPDSHTETFYKRLAQLKADVTVADFLKQYFEGPQYERLRYQVTRMVEGYDAADPARASMLALRDEWTNSDRSGQGRIVGGYGALVEFLAAECRRLGVALQFHAAVSAIETDSDQVIVRCANGQIHRADAVMLTLPLPVLNELTLPPALRARTSAAMDIGFGNVIKLLLRFKTRWWTSDRAHALSDLSFLISDQIVPVWWTQHPAEHALLTGWLAGPRTSGLDQLEECALIEKGLASLGAIFDLPAKQLNEELVAARAINWARDPLARGAYSYATPETRKAQSKLTSRDGEMIFISGEALYRGREMGTVEAALASGQESARDLLRAFLN